MTDASNAAVPPFRLHAVLGRFEPIVVTIYLGWALIATLTLSLEPETRDAVLLAGALLCVLYATVDFAGAWMWFVFILPLVHMLGAMFGLSQLTFVRLVLVGLALVFPIAGGGVRLPRDLLRHWGFRAFLLFVAANVAAAMHARSIEAVARTVTYLEPVLFFAFSYCIVRRRPADARGILRALVLGGLVVVVFGVVEIMTQESIFKTLGVTLPTEDEFQVYFEANRFGLGGRITSTIGQPVYTSLYYVIWLVVSIYYVLTFERGYARVLLTTLVPAGLLVTLATGTRAPLFGLIPMLLILMWVAPGRSKLKLLIASGVAAVFIVLSAPTLIGYLRASVDIEERTIENANVVGRIELTNRFIEYFARSPVWGYGPGVIQHEASRGVKEFVGLDGVENQYAVILADGGLLAGGAYLAFVVASMYGLFRPARRDDRSKRNPALMTLALLVFYFAAVVTVTCLTQIPNDVLMIAYGVAAATLDDAKTREHEPAA